MARSLNWLTVLAILGLTAGCGVHTPTLPQPPPVPTELSWRERVRRAVDTLGDQCYPGRHFELDPSRGESTATAGVPYDREPASTSSPSSSPRRRSIAAAEDLDYLGDVEFAIFRKATSELVLIGTPADPGSGIRAEDWFTVLRAISGPEAPGVTIDPGPNPSLMQVRYFGGIGQTTLGESFFEADRTLKLLSTGFDNNTCRAWEGRPPGIPTEMDLYSKELWSSASATAREGWHRYWFEPSSEPLETEDTPASSVVKIPINRLVVNDESIPPGRTSRSAHEFAAAVTENFLDATAKVPSFQRLQFAAALVAVAKWMQDKQIPADESWLGKSIPPFAAPETTPSITVLRAELRDQVYLRYGIHGGIDFQKDNTYRSAPSVGEAIAIAVTKGEPPLGSRWDFSVGDKKYRAVKMRIEHPVALTARRIRWVRVVDGLALAQPGLYRLAFPESKLQIINIGVSPLSIKLRGPVPKDLSVSAASEMFTVLPGFYEITVSSGHCLPRTDTFTVNEGESYKLQFECRTPPPPPRPPEGFYIIENQTGAPVQVTINGPTSKTQQAPAGTSTISLAPGSYSVVVSATCGQTNETFVIRAGSQFTARYWCQVIR